MRMGERPPSRLQNRGGMEECLGACSNHASILQIYQPSSSVCMVMKGLGIPSPLMVNALTSRL